MARIFEHFGNSILSVPTLNLDLLAVILALLSYIQRFLFLIGS